MNPFRFLLRRHYRRIGKLGGQARSEQLREPIRAKARELCREIGKAVPEALL
jgi:hypothetical protein